MVLSTGPRDRQVRREWREMMFRHAGRKRKQSAADTKKMSNWQEAAGKNRWNGIKARRKVPDIYQSDNMTDITHGPMWCWWHRCMHRWHPNALLHRYVNPLLMDCISTCGSFSPPQCQLPVTGVLPPLIIQTLLFYLLWVYKTSMAMIHCTVSWGEGQIVTEV